MLLSEYISKKYNEKLSIKNLNDVDLGCLALLPLLDVDNTFPKDNKFDSLINIYGKYHKIHAFEGLGVIYPKSLIFDLDKIAKSPRYKDLQIGNTFCLIDGKVPTQSTFFEIRLDEKNSIIVFGSTDTSIAGWKEDFLLLLDQISPCLTHSLNYIENLPLDKNYIFIGHSKGGMEAFYAGTLGNKKVINKVKRIVCYDSPGFSKEVFKKIRESKNFSKVTFYAPERTTVSNILYQDIKKKMVYSTAVSLFQHSIGSWEIEGDSYKIIKDYIPKDDIASTKVNIAYNEVNKETYLKFVNDLFSIFEASGEVYFEKIAKHKKKCIKQFFLLSGKEKSNLLAFGLFLISENLVSKSLFKNFLLKGKTTKKYNFKKYLKLYAKEKINKDTLSDVDLALFSYLPLIRHCDVPENGFMNYKDFITKYKKQNLKVKKLTKATPKYISKYILKTLNIDRYEDIKIGNYYSYRNDNEEVSVTILELVINDDLSVIVCGPIDDYITGWAEVYNMIFKKNPPSFEYTLNYFNNRINSKKKNIIVGLSIGGTNAIYAFNKCNETVRKSIIKVVTFDNIGFTKEVSNKIAKSPKCSIVTSYTSQNPLFFDLFYQPIIGKHAVSDASKFYKFNPLTWKIKNKEFLINEFKYKKNNFARKINLMSEHFSVDRLLLVKSLFFDTLRSTNKETLIKCFHKKFKLFFYIFTLPRHERKIIYTFLHLLKSNKPLTKGFIKYIFSK